MSNISTKDSALEVADVLLQRVEFVECLLAEPKDKRDLVDELGVSRSTVDRATRELETRDLIEYSSTGFTPTPLCEQAADEFFTLRETIGYRVRLDPLLRWIPDGALDLDLSHLADADLVVAEPGDPYAMINRHVQLLAEMDRGRFVLPYTGTHAAETAREQIVENGAQCELVVEPTVADAFGSDPYTPVVEEMVATGRFDVFVYEGSFPYGLALVDGTVQIISDENEEPRALVETRAEEVWDWAEDTYAQYKQESEKLI